MSGDGTPSPLVTGELPSMDANHTPVQHILSDGELQDIIAGHEMLATVFEDMKGRPAWASTIQTIAAKYNSGFKRLVDCSFLVDAAAPEPKVLSAPEPLGDPLQLGRVRESFLKMASNVATHVEERMTGRHGLPEASWNLPPEAEAHPRVFWEKIWNAFDFSTPQYMDAALGIDAQHPDVRMYLTTLGFWSDASLDKSSLEVYLGYDRPEDTSEPGPKWRYETGCEFLQDVLHYKHGIHLKPKGSERAEPFPWLDCQLSHFKSLGWEFFETVDEHSFDGCWGIDYHDRNRDDPLQPFFDGDHFASFSYQEMLLTNIRVPLPRRVLRHRITLLWSMRDLYGQHHPLQKLGETRTLVLKLGGDQNSDHDLKAAMLYQVISRLAKGNLSFFPLLLDESLNEDEDDADVDPRWSKHKPRFPVHFPDE